jgi:hypothetical protein
VSKQAHIAETHIENVQMRALDLYKHTYIFIYTFE